MGNSNIYKTIFYGMFLYVLIFFAVSTFLFLENEELRKRENRMIKEINELGLVEEGEIVSIDDLETGGVIYVLYLDEKGNSVAIIEVDVFPEIVHTSIDVGDTAIYCRDWNWTDADLLAIEKKKEIS